MTLRSLRIPAALVFGTTLLAVSALAQSRSSASPYGGTTVEDIIARVNDQIITNSDYNRALKELNDDEREHGATMQEMSDARKDLLRNLIDQQLWLSKGKELDITGETELVNRLNEIRKQYNLASLEDLQKAAEQQGVSYEDFKANIRNQIITQEVMRDEVGRKITITPGEAERYYEAHKQEYAQQESVQLAEILVSTGTPASSAADVGVTPLEDPQKIAAAKAKAEDIEAKLHAGGNFAQLAKSFSDGPTASEGGDLGQFRRGALAKVLEDKVFVLKAGQYTEPIRTRQGFVILKVEQHTPGGVPPFKDVEDQVEQAYYVSKMEPAMRAYLTQMRDDAYIEIKPGYIDTGASPNKRVFPIAYSAYTPPAPKKKKKIERTRFRETTHGFRQKSSKQGLTLSENSPPQSDKKKHKGKHEEASMKPGKKEKIRYGQAPQETLPNSPASQTEDAGALPRQAPSGDLEPENPLEASAPEKKTRFSDLARQHKHHKSKGSKKDEFTAQPPTAAEVADRQQQSAPLGLAGDTASKKKKKSTTTGEKTRFSDEKKKKSGEESQPPEPTPIAPVPGAPAPAAAPQQ